MTDIEIKKKKKKKKCKCQPFNPQPNPLGLLIGEEVLVRDGRFDSWTLRVFLGYVKSQVEEAEHRLAYLWLTESVDIGEEVVVWLYAKPAHKTKMVVKSATAIMESLLSAGYVVNDFGYWVKRGVASFDTDMWIYCGREPNTNWNWEPEWLEEVPIK